MMDKDDLFLPGTFETETLITWAKSRDPNEEYDYRHNSECLLAKYFQERLINRNHSTLVGTDFGFVVNENDSTICKYEFDPKWNDWAIYKDENGLNPKVRTVKGFLEAANG